MKVSFGTQFLYFTDWMVQRLKNEDPKRQKDLYSSGNQAHVERNWAQGVGDGMGGAPLHLGVEMKRLCK